MQWLVEYNAALASICFMTLLGFVDDVLDVPWRVWVSSHLCLFCSLSICFSIFLELLLDFILICFLVIVKSRKLLLPSFAALPLLMAYAGHTTIIIPKPLVSYVGLEILDLGMVFDVEKWYDRENEPLKCLYVIYFLSLIFLHQPIFKHGFFFWL